MAKVMLAMGLIVAYGYMMEVFNAFYSGDVFEAGMQMDRFGGFYSPLFWGLIAANVVIPQMLCSRACAATRSSYG